MVARKRCEYCGALFIPDKRIGARQRACSPSCQKERKRDNNKEFGKNNPGYWRGRYEVVKEWRQQHPEYQRAWRKQQQEKQEEGGEIQAEIGRAWYRCGSFPGAPWSSSWMVT